MRHDPSNPIRIPIRLLAGACAVALAVLSAGCSTDRTPLARVGNQTITVGDYRQAAENAGGRYAGSPDSTRMQLLEDMVRRTLMIEYAYQAGIVKDSLLDRFRSEAEKQALVGALSRRMVPRTVPVSEAEIDSLHAWRDSSSHVQVIYTQDRAMAAAARAELDRGTPFADVANHFNPAGMLPAGGDLGFVQVGSLVGPLDTAVRKAPVGELIGPFEAGGEGWFVLRVLDRRAEPEVDLAKARGQLSQMLGQRKRRALSVAAFQKLRDVYHLEVEPGAAHTLLAFVHPPGMQYGAPPPEPDSAQRAQVLARWDGGPGLSGTFTLGEAVDDLDSGIQDRPNAAMLSTFDPWIEARAMQRVALTEARRRRLMDEPDIAEQVRNRVDGYLLETVYNDAVVLNSNPGEQDYRQAWEDFDDPNKGSFESMSEALRSHLGPEAVRIASQRRLIAFTDSLRHSVPVTINARLLRRLPKPSGVLMRG